MAVALEDGEWITTCYFPTHILACGGKEGGRAAEPRSVLEGIVGGFEKRFLEEQLRIHGWSRQKTAQRLGVHRNTIDNKIKKLGIIIPD
jgi:DNA-binding NtrC family response regulator